MVISEQFKQLRAPLTDRRVIQLTEGEAFCYPLYYFIPSISGSYLVYHRCDKQGVQLHRLDLSTGESIQLTRAISAETQWNPWCVEAGPGVRDHRSVLNIIKNEVVYFDGNDMHAVHLESLKDRLVYTLPADRIPISQNCVSADGEWLIYIHHDRVLYDDMFPVSGGRYRHLSRGTQLCACNLDTGENKTLIVAHSPYHHVQPWQSDKLVFSSMATERSILITDYKGGYYTHIRTQDTDGGMTCHYCATAAGIAYEVLNERKSDLGGLYNPNTHQRIEFDLPTQGGVHTGFDAEGKLWFYESLGATSGFRQMLLLTHYKGKQQTEWLQLTGDWPVYSGGQKAHHHPRLTYDRRFIIFTAGDSSTKTNHIYLLDVAEFANDTSLPLQSIQ